MYKLCKTEQSASRQRKLEEGLLHAMKTRRYDEITISDLCDQIGIPRKSFYRYFSGKDGALHALIDHTLLEFQRAMGVNEGAKFDPQTVLQVYFGFWKEHRTLLDALEKNHLSGLLVQRAVSYAQSEFMSDFYRLPHGLRGVQKQAVSFTVCGLMSMVLVWHNEGYCQTPQEMAAIAAAVMSSPLLDVPPEK